MKMLTRISLALVLITGLAVAQNGIWLSGGLNISTAAVDPDDGIDISSQMGFNAGAAFELALSEMFAIIPGVAIETRGVKMDIDLGPFGNIEAESKLLYLEIPVLAQANIVAGTGKLNIFAGPELGLLLSAKDQDDEDIKDNTESLDLGIAVGVGYEMPVGPGSIAIRPSYSFGLLNISKVDGQEAKNRNLKIAAAYKINL